LAKEPPASPKLGTFIRITIQKLDSNPAVSDESKFVILRGKPLFSDHPIIRYGDHPIFSATPSLPLISISKGLTPFIPIDPQIRLLQTQAFI